MAANDFSKAKHVKAEIETLKKTPNLETSMVSPSIAAQIASLEAKKAEAMAADDLHKAGDLKAEIENLKKRPNTEVDAVKYKTLIKQVIADFYQ